MAHLTTFKFFVTLLVVTTALLGKIAEGYSMTMDDIASEILKAATLYGKLVENTGKEPTPFKGFRELYPRYLPIRLGVYLFLDVGYEGAFETSKKYGSLTDYLHILVESAELRFLRLRDPPVTLSLIGYEKSNFSFAEGTDKRVNYTATITQLSKKIEGNKTAYATADVVIGITERSMYLSWNWDAEWTGAPTVGGACTDAKVGLISDDAKSFNGSSQLAVQIATLLGATPDHHIYGESLLSNPGGDFYALSDRSCNQIRILSQKMVDKACWRERPAPLIKELPADFQHMSENVCARSPNMKNLTQCEDKEFHHRVCTIQCCTTIGKREVVPGYFVPDGKPCNREGMCIANICLDPYGKELKITKDKRNAVTKKNSPPKPHPPN